MRACRLHSPDPRHMKPSLQSIRGAAASDSEWFLKSFPLSDCLPSRHQLNTESNVSGAHLEKQGFQFLQILVTHSALIYQKLSIHKKYTYRKLVLYNRFFVWIRHLWASLQNILSLSPSPLFGRGRETDPWGLYPQPQHMQGTHSTELSPTTLGFKY